MNNNLINEIQTDFLIIGSGLSGLYSAIYASNFGTVTLVTKSSIQESNSYWAQGGIAAALEIKTIQQKSTCKTLYLWDVALTMKKRLT